MKRAVRNLVPPSARRFLRRLVNRTGRRITPRCAAPPTEWAGVLSAFIAYNRYGAYCVPHSSLHRPAAQKILAGDVQEPDTIDYMLAHCGQGDIVHAGTYFGDFLPALSRGCSSSASVWAFEPNRENYRCAEITVRLNELQNVQLFNAGLGERNERAHMKIADHTGQSLGGGSHILRHSHATTGDDVEPVRLVSIDETIPDDRLVSVIQLDVEEYEQPALAGALRTIRRCLPVLILENLPEPAWFSANILALGYRESGKVHRNAVFLSESTQEPDAG